MRRNYAMRKLERQHRKPAELLLVPMIDIFTVLVTFLLMTAVFSRTVIMELKLPKEGGPATELPPGLVLEVVLRKSGLAVQDRKTGLLKDGAFPRAAGTASYDLAGLSTFLQQVKAQYPDKTEATLLLEPEVPYDDLVQVMDIVRTHEERQGGKFVQVELFPDISLGDAEGTGQGARP
jgi:biopolymer transport protein ExbD